MERDKRCKLSAELSNRYWPNYMNLAEEVAFAKLVNNIFETYRNSNGDNEFRLVNIANMYERIG